MLMLEFLRHKSLIRAKEFNQQSCLIQRLNILNVFFTFLFYFTDEWAYIEWEFYTNTSPASFQYVTVQGYEYFSLSSTDDYLPFDAVTLRPETYDLTLGINFNGYIQSFASSNYNAAASESPLSYFKSKLFKSIKFFLRLP